MDGVIEVGLGLQDVGVELASGEELCDLGNADYLACLFVQ